MKRLYLLRHAKSSWDELGLPDHERPLAPRGRAATALLAAHLGNEEIKPALVLYSPARRSEETFNGIAPALGDDVESRAEPELYGASAGDLLARLQQVPEVVPSAMLIGHNPAVEDLAAILARGHEHLARIERKYPTGALATFTFEGDWSELAPDAVRQVSFVRPKDLR
jgi:phosphohistidine phosphatase